MRSLLYLVAVICVIIWAYEFFFTGGANTSGLIHILLVIAIISVLIAVIRKA